METVAIYNVRLSDSMFRIIMGIAVLSLGFQYQSLWGMTGLVPLMTGIVGWCPVYKALGISTLARSRINTRFLVKERIEESKRRWL
ncbi:YgaP family membrane protein [Fodinibius sediminis]|uniref:Inner membrane protein YgaP-like transmembrane domain-containing protein n=1 Tax=Fodinibius sediminis TaxID=1214077 RepID=A0A521CUV2_9BACT|nr:Protein of unknown function [Fodinibius sediminis]